MFEDSNGEFYYVELIESKEIKAIIDYYINLLKEILNLVKNNFIMQKKNIEIIH